MFEDFDDDKPENPKEKPKEKPKKSTTTTEDNFFVAVVLVIAIAVGWLLENWKKIFESAGSEKKAVPKSGATSTNISHSPVINATFRDVVDDKKVQGVQVGVSSVAGYLPPPKNLGFIDELSSLNSGEEGLKLKVFLSHSSMDKGVVNVLSKRLACHGVDVWVDSEKLLPGQKWETEIELAIEKSSAVIVCLSKNSMNREGFLQKEIKKALLVEEFKPSGAIYLIPARLDDCEIPFELRSRQWVDLFTDSGFSRLLSSLDIRARDLGVSAPRTSISIDQKESQKLLDLIDLYTNHGVKVSAAAADTFQISHDGLRLANNSLIEDALDIATLLKDKGIVTSKFEGHAEKILGGEPHTTYTLKDKWLGISLVIVCRSKESLNDVKTGVKQLLRDRYGLSYYK